MERYRTCLNRGVLVGAAATRAWLGAYYGDWSEAERYIGFASIHLKNAQEDGCLSPAESARLAQLMRGYTDAVRSRDLNRVIDQSKRFEGAFRG